MRSITILLGCIFFFGCKSQTHQPVAKKSNNNNTLLWQVSGKDLKEPSYIFGTFHLMCKDDIRFSEQLKKSVASAGEIYMEMDMDDPSTMLSGLLYMNMKNGKKLKDLYTADEYKKVEGYFKDSLSMPMMMFQGIKPYFLVAMLYPKMMNCKTASGIEEELMKIAKENKKEIKGLETMQFQASVFDSIPYEWQAKELLKNIDSFSVYKKEFDTMMLEYKNQQLSSMEKLLGKSEFGSDKKYEEILLTNRNKNWVNQLKNIMNKESVFVAVGAGHLVGEKGLLNLLKQEGYTVEPLLNK
ncbi:MAG TPA: TraB/GumN family protein [Chitinophagaceae bacterium]|nr:TraB/GumN family protein [Chitinophagaceae bacterium]